MHAHIATTDIFRSYRKKFMRTAMLLVLFSSIFLVPSLTLISPVKAETQWWNTDWSFRKQIVINHSMVAADLTDYPVLIVDNNLTGAQPSGGDIVFVNDQNIKLDHEIESYDSNAGLLVAWVRIPLLSSTVDTIIYMYFGNSGAQDQQNRTGVWNTNFVMIQHLEETSTVRYDSSANHNNGTTYGGVSKSPWAKIDGADLFDGVNDYTSFVSSASLNPSSAMTVELWVNLTSTGDYINLVNKGTYSQYYLRLGPSEGNVYWYVKFADGTTAYKAANIGWKFNKWHHIAATVDTQASTMKVYLDGVEKLSYTFTSGKTLASSTSPVVLSGSNRCVKGSTDEVRISNIARASAWLQTSYNNQQNPTLFAVVGSKETGNTLPSPIVYENPLNGTTDVYTNPTLSVNVVDPNGLAMIVIFKEKTASGVWTDLRVYEDVPDGSYSADATQMTKLGTTFYWRACVGDGQSWTNKTYILTTTSTILQLKWAVNPGTRGVTGVLAADINKDGKDEVIFAGNNSVVALDGDDGHKIWSYSDSDLGDHAQPQMADLNKDGILEIIVALQMPAGLLVLHSNDGSLYWRLTGLGPETYSSPVVFDVDGNGYPTIFVGTTDTGQGLNGAGRLTSISYDGRILHQVFVWRPCGGGLSLADANLDGEYEVYMSDRYAYFSASPWADNDYGRGVQSYLARNLTLVWSRPDVFCSSQRPMIVDANKDGKLDVVIGDLNGGWWVLNATDGSTIKHRSSTLAPSHYQPSAYDIDNDGNLEIMTADGSDEAINNNTAVWDLVTNHLDADMALGKSFYGPQVGDVDGDGHMEMISATENGIFIINGSYKVIASFTGLSPNLNYGVLQDIDGDGYNELIVSTRSGTVYAFDTPGRRPTIRPRTEVQFYSEYRRGAAEYVMPQGGPAPVVLLPSPQNRAENVPLSLSKVEFNLVDYQHDPMNFTVTISPNIINGTNTGIDVDSRRYSISVGGLSPSTTYTWNITATDGTHQTNATYFFTTLSISPWIKGDWKYRKTIIIHHEKVSSEQSNFPVLINITDTDLSKAQPSGGDIIFTDANNNQLNHEIEYFNSASGNLVAWVNVHHLSPEVDTVLNMYYGNSNIGDQQKPSLTWDSGYAMVQHMEETTTARKDSTSNGNDATTYGGVSKSPYGLIDGADLYDGVNDYATVPSSASLNPSSTLTVELWMNLTSTGNYVNLINKGSWSQYYLRLGPNEGNVYWYVKFADGTTAYKAANIGWKFNKWHHIAAIVDTQVGIMKVYLDGAEKLSYTFTSGKTLALSTSPVVLSGGNRWVKGSIDEVRVSSVVRSSAWLQTSFNNQKYPETFSTEGDEEIVPIGPVIYALSPADRTKDVLTSISTLSFNLTDAQSNLMSYTVTTNPDVGHGEGTNVAEGRFTVSVADLHYSTTYRWVIKVTDGLHWTNRTLSFTTTPSAPPTQDNPTLTVDSKGNLLGQNETTTDSDGDKVTNIYNWYRNGTSLTNLLLPFDTNSSSTTKDYSGYGNDGFIIRGATWTSNGKIGGAYNFNKGYILVPGSDTLDGGGLWSEITVEHWIYLSGSQSNARTIARIPSYEIGLTGVNSSFANIYASVWIDPHNASLSGLHHTSSALISTGAWHHVVLTYKSGDRIRLYIDGKQVAYSESFSGHVQRSGFNPLYIGWFDYFKGKIDEVRIYPRSLSASQIGQRYNETKDGLSSSSTILKIETQLGEVWQCAVTPNDSHIDGAMKISNSIAIGN